MTLRALRLMLAAASPFVLAAPAFAAHNIVFGPRADAFAASSAHQGPNVATSAIHVVNGSEVPQDRQQGPGGTVAGGGSATTSTANASQPGGAGDRSFGNSAYAAADLASGSLKASTLSYGPENFGTPAGTAQSRLDDTIFFTNTSGGALTATLRYLFDGQMTIPDTGGNPGGSLGLTLSCIGSNCVNDMGERIVFATGPTRAPDESWFYFFDYQGNGCFGENLFCGQGAAPYFQWGLNQPNANGVVDGWISTSLVIPTGLSSVGLRGVLNVSCGAASSCDFGNTGKFRFDALPSGLSFSSSSGTFLSALNSGVPEPDTWALMIVGLGAVGGALRARRQARLRIAPGRAATA